MNYPSLVSLREVAPRDGWQKFKTVLPTEVKRELICSMIDYGARELEIGVFSSDPVRGRQTGCNADRRRVDYILSRKIRHYKHTSYSQRSSGTDIVFFSLGSLFA